MGVCIYVDGNFYTDKEKATISVYDHGFLYGDGIFEGIRAYNGRIFKLKEHIKRLYQSAVSILLTIPLAPAKIEELVIETCRRTGEKDIYIRLVVSRGKGDLGLDPRKCPKPTIIIIADKITLYPPEKYQNGVSVITSSIRRNRPDTLTAQVKSLNYLNNILAKVETYRYGADEAIMLNDEGYVSEATADNIFIIKNSNKLYTPPAYLGILEGITRGCVMELASKMGYTVIEEPFTTHDIFTAEECFLTGTGAELIPVIEIDERIIGDGKPGKHFKKLLAGYQELTRSEGVPIC
ncbi:MAG: branched-chain-amino-acid transaminase [Planctomycetota bacterium]|nr:branched-chain-amino-acid transaminase [Planctomycetota bacterium]MDI6787523.1 branched-chain-amino-acid transaminase [Planctomycetota bacterium]